MLVQIEKEALDKAWALIYTREWPFSFMEDLAAFKIAYNKAVSSGVARDDQNS